MLKIRLRRVGAKKQPSYRIVVAESTSPRDGRFLEILGHYNPRTEPETVVVNVDRAAYWVSHGAQPTEAVDRLLKKQGVYDSLKAGQAGQGGVAAAAAGVVSTVTETASSAAAKAADVVSGAASSLVDVAAPAVSTVADAATTAASTVADAASSVAAKAADVVSSAVDTVRGNTDDDESEG